ncbi:MAG: RsmB/NOP family class I SAM-dependent RNA methyltransferase [Opitutaceae bacterium]
MSLAGSQQKVFLRLVGSLRPHWRRDPSLPSRIQELFAVNRSFGSRDRRLYRELIYTTLRYLPWIEPLLDSDPHRATQTVAWLAADLPATHAFRIALGEGWMACPGSLAAKAAHLKVSVDDLVPSWLARHCPEAAVSPDLDALLTRAPLWLRMQAPHAGAVLSEFTAKGWEWRRSEILPGAVQLLTETDVTKTSAWERGWFEVQDLGSQSLLETTMIQAGSHWLDACAGAGGKTLQLSALVGAAGHVDAHDIRPQALRELTIRATRAGALNIAVLEALPVDKKYDGVLVDAPCTGSGTWRRAPHLKWTTSAAQVTEAAEKQLLLLTQFAGFVRAGGQLIYATCSLSRMENEEVVEAFLNANPQFEPAAPARTFDATARRVGLAILPARHNTDGFFVAALRRR